MITSAQVALLVIGLAGAPMLLGASPSPVDVGALAREQVQRFKAHARELPPPGTPWFELLEGTSKVLITAPHATAQSREGKLKGSDLGTGALAVVLHRVGGTPALFTTWASPSDPNYYDDNPFKVALERFVTQRKPRLVLDLHASREDRPYDLDFGTLRGRSLAKHATLLGGLRKRLLEHGLRDLSDNAFPGELQATVVRFLTDRGVPCIQLEINARWLRPERGPAELQRFLNLVRALELFIQDVDQGG